MKSIEQVLGRREPEQEDPRLFASARLLQMKVTNHCAYHDFSKQTLQEIDEIIEDHRKRARNQGVRFPRMVVLTMDRHRAIRIYRRDIEPKDIDGRVIPNLTREFPHADAGEIARGIQRAWPGHRCDPSTVTRQG